MAEMEFLDEIPINITHTLQQLLGRYQSVHDGLPELIKNAKDQYSRLGVTEIGERVIIVLLNSETKRLGVLDFGGAKKDDFVGWREWANPYANRAELASDIEGGFGTGGKGFMVRGATEDSFFESSRDGLRTKMGYSSTESNRQYYPAFFKEKGKRVDNVKDENVRKQLDLVLEGLGTTYDALPASAKAVFQARKAFTIVQLNGVRDWAGRRSTVRQLIGELPEDLMEHAQAALSIESCSVFVVIDGKLASDKPLHRSYPEPLQGFENLPAIPVPAKLKDPKSGEMIDTGAEKDPAKHVLQLNTSRQTLRMANNKAINVVRIRNARNVVSNWSIADLVPHASSGYIYGTLTIPTLSAEHQVGTDRVTLADTALVRALRSWTTQQLSDLTAKIQKAISKEHKPQELDKANDGLRKMREIMKKFLDDGARGRGGSGEDEPEDKRTGKVVRQIVLERGAQGLAMAKGTSVPLMVRAYDIIEGERVAVRGANLEFVSEPPNLVSQHRRILTALAPGRTTIWFKDAATGVESNKVEVEIVEATSAEIQELPSRVLLQGEEVPLRVVFTTTRQTRGQVIVEKRHDLVVDAEVDEQNMGRVDRYGVFTAGGHEGQATIRVRYGAGDTDTIVGVVQIGTERLPKREKKQGNDGADVPIVLLCGVQAPNMEQYPEEQRTIMPSEHWPTIIDYEPPFEPDVIFINPDSKESFHVRSGRGGRRGSAGIGSETYLQFLALKCFEILKRLYVSQSVKDGAMTKLQFLQTFAEAEVVCAAFVDQAFLIAHELSASVKDQE